MTVDDWRRVIFLPPDLPTPDPDDDTDQEDQQP